jgi:hypothetical protein
MADPLQNTHGLSAKLLLSFAISAPRLHARVLRGTYFLSVLLEQMLVRIVPARRQVCIAIKYRIPSRLHADEHIKKLSYEFNQIGFRNYLH